MQARYRRLYLSGKTQDAKAFLLSDPDDNSKYESVQMWKDNVICVALDASASLLGALLLTPLLLLLHAAGHSAPGEDALDRVQAIFLGILFLPPLLTYIGQRAELTGEFSLRTWLVTLPLSYPIALSLGGSVALMLLIGPIVLLRRRRAGPHAIARR